MDWNTIALRQVENEAQFSDWHNSLVTVTWLIRDAALNSNSFQAGSASDPLKVFDRMLEGLQVKRQTLTNIENHIKNLQHELRSKRINFGTTASDHKIPLLSAAAQSFFPVMGLVRPQLMLSQPQQQFCLPQATPYSLAVNLAPPAPARVAPRQKKAIPIVSPGPNVLPASVNNSMMSNVGSRAGNDSGSDVSPYSIIDAPVEEILPEESVPEPAFSDPDDIVEENIIYEAQEPYRSPGPSEASETFFSCAPEGEDNDLGVECANKEIQADLSNDEGDMKEDVTLTASLDEQMDVQSASPSVEASVTEAEPEPAPPVDQRPQWEIDRSAFDPFEVEQLQKVRTEPAVAPVKGKSGWGDIDEWLENNNHASSSPSNHVFSSGNHVSSSGNHVSSSTGKSSFTLSPSASIPTTAPGSPISTARIPQPQFSDDRSSRVNGDEADAYLYYDASVAVDASRTSVVLKSELLECIYRRNAGKPAVQHLSDYQWEIIGNVDEGRSLLTQGPPRSGKTMAYVIGVLNQLRIEERMCQCIIVAETYHKIDQIAELLKELGAGLDVRRLVEREHGREMESNRFKHDRSSPSHVIVCRPQSVRDMLLSAGMDTKGITMVVFDEVEAISADSGAIFMVMNMPHEQLDALIKAEFAPAELELLPETYLSDNAEVSFKKPATF